MEPTTFSIADFWRKVQEDGRIEEETTANISSGYEGLPSQKNFLEKIEGDCETILKN